MSKKTNTASRCLPQGSGTGSSRKPPSSPISEHSTVTGTPKAITVWLMSSQRDSPVNPSPAPASDKAQTTSETCGPKPCDAFARYDHDTHSWKTFPALFPAATLPPYSETWPRAGMTRDGVSYRRLKWERRINEIGCGLWPTAVAQDDGKTPEAHMRMKARMKGGPRKTCTSLQVMVKGVERAMWLTPTQRDYRSQHAENSEAFEARKGHPRGVNLVEEMQRRGVGGQLNPRWVEWLMGWPIGWVSLEPLATDKFQEWWRQHGV